MEGRGGGEEKRGEGGTTSRGVAKKGRGLHLKTGGGGVEAGYGRFLPRVSRK